MVVRSHPTPPLSYATAKTSTVKKHADPNPHFCDIENCCIMYPDIKIVDIEPETQHKFTVQNTRMNQENHTHRQTCIYAKQAILKKNCTSKKWFERVIIPNGIHDNRISTEMFFFTTLANQSSNFELEPLKKFFPR